MKRDFWAEVDEFQRRLIREEAPKHSSRSSLAKALGLRSGSLATVAARLGEPIPTQPPLCTTKTGNGKTPGSASCAMCSSRAVAKGLCRKHYSEKWKAEMRAKAKNLLGDGR